MTAADLYRLGLTGGDGSAKLRDFVCCELGLPSGMGAKAFLEAVNILSDMEEIEKILAKIPL